MHVSTFLALLVLAPVSAGEPQGGAILDYDVNIRLKGYIECRDCPAEANAEIVLSRDGGTGLTGTILSRSYEEVNQSFNGVRNFSWGQRVTSTDAPRNRLEISVYIADCGHTRLVYVLEELPFHDNEFILDLGHLQLVCGRGDS